MSSSGRRFCLLVHREPTLDSDQPFRSSRFVFLSESSWEMIITRTHRGSETCTIRFQFLWDICRIPSVALPRLEVDAKPIKPPSNQKHGLTSWTRRSRNRVEFFLSPGLVFHFRRSTYLGPQCISERGPLPWTFFFSTHNIQIKSHQTKSTI
jgi:hypothetical protein